ncbi:RNA chaperone Hfq [Shigella flexneri]
MIRSFKSEEEYLNCIKDEDVTINLFLVSGIKLVGKVSGFDDRVIWLNGKDVEGKPQMVYKTAISTIVPHVNLEKK